MAVVPADHAETIAGKDSKRKQAVFRNAAFRGFKLENSLGLSIRLQAHSPSRETLTHQIDTRRQELDDITRPTAECRTATSTEIQRIMRLVTPQLGDIRQLVAWARRAGKLGDQARSVGCGGSICTDPRV